MSSTNVHSNKKELTKNCCCTAGISIPDEKGTIDIPPKTKGVGPRVYEVEQGQNMIIEAYPGGSKEYMEAMKNSKGKAEKVEEAKGEDR